MTARRTNKKRPLRQTTGEKFPSIVVDSEAAAEERPPLEPESDLKTELQVGATTESGLISESEPGSASAPEPMPAPTPVSETAPESQPELGLEMEAAATPEPGPTSASEPVSEPKPEPTPQPEPEPEKSKQQPAPAPRSGRPTPSEPAADALKPSPVVEPTESADAQGCILMSVEAQTMALRGYGAGNDAITSARVSGILAGKRAGELVPSCPALTVVQCQMNIQPILAPDMLPLSGWAPARDDGRVGFIVHATCTGSNASAVQTSALTAVSATCLALFDQLHASDPAIEITGLRGGCQLLAVEPAETASAADTTPSAPASPLPGGAGAGTPAPAIAFIGYQNAGKTTLVERVIAKLSGRGLRVGSIKLHGPKGFDIDQPGKDSWRHAQAGSRHVGLISPDQYAEYASTEQEVPVADLLTHFTDVDVVVVEGYKTTGIPSIVVARSGVDRIRGTNSYELVDADTLAVACNDVTARGFRAQWGKLAEEAGEQPNAEAPVPLPSFLDINDVPEIVSFVVDSLDLGKK